MTDEGDNHLGWVQEYHKRKGLDGGHISRALEKGKAGLRFQDASEVYLVPVMVWNRWAKKGW